MDIMNNLRYLGPVGVAFLAFVVYCVVKGGKQKSDGNNRSGNAPRNNTTQSTDNNIQ